MTSYGDRAPDWPGNEPTLEEEAARAARELMEQLGLGRTRRGEIPGGRPSVPTPHVMTTRPGEILGFSAQTFAAATYGALLYGPALFVSMGESRHEETTEDEPEDTEDDGAQP